MTCICVLTLSFLSSELKAIPNPDKYPALAELPRSILSGDFDPQGPRQATLDGRLCNCAEYFGFRFDRPNVRATPHMIHNPGIDAVLGSPSEKSPEMQTGVSAN